MPTIATHILRGIIPVDGPGRHELRGCVELGSTDGWVEPGWVEGGWVEQEEETPDHIIPRFDATIDDSAVGTIFPKTTRQQVIAPFRIKIDGQILPFHQRKFGAWVREERTGPSTFGFTFIREGRGTYAGALDLGDVKSNFGPPGSWQSVDIDAIYLTPTGPKAYRLLTNGTIVPSTRKLNDPEGELWEVQGEGAYGRHDLAEVEVVHLPGHGRTRADLINEILESVGWTDRAVGELPRDHPLYKEVQLICAVGLDAAQQILRAGGLGLREDREGTARVIDLLPDASPTPEITFTLTDLITGTVEESADTNGPPRVEVTGSQQLIREGADAGYTTTSRVRTHETNYAPRVPDKRVGETGISDDPNLGDSGLTQPEEEPRLTTRVTELVTDFLGVMTANRQTIEQWYAPEKATGKTAPMVVLENFIDSITLVEVLTISGTPGTPSYVSTTDFEQVGDFGISIGSTSGATAGTGRGTVRITFDEAIGSTEVVEKQPLDSLSTDWDNEREFVDTLSGRGVPEEGERFRITRVQALAREFDERGFLVREVTYVERFYIPRAALAEKFHNGTKFYLWDVRRLFSGEGVTEDEEIIREFSRLVVESTVTDEGFVSERISTREGWHRDGGGDGSVYNYRDEKGYDRSEEVYGTTSHVTETWQPNESNSTVFYAIEELDGEGNFVSRRTDDNFGYLPAAEKLPDTPDPALYPNRRVASREEQQQIVASVEFEDLLAVREDWTLRVSDSWVETIAEAEALARLIIAEGNGAQVPYEVPLNIGVRPNQYVRLDGRPYGWDYTVRNEGVLHAEIEGDRPEFRTSVDAVLELVA